jgi:hypothetical protein
MLARLLLMHVAGKMFARRSVRRFLVYTLLSYVLGKRGVGPRFRR